MTTNRSKKFETPVGNFEYLTVNDAYYPIGIKQQIVENKCAFLIATPEKALCDMIITTPQLRIQSQKTLKTYLEEDLRFDMSILNDMNKDIIRRCMKTGKKKGVLKLLLNLL